MFLGGGGGGLSSRPFAEATQAEIDKEVSALLRDAETRAINLLKAHRPELDSLVSLLLEVETVDGSDVTGWPASPTGRPSSRRSRSPPAWRRARPPPPTSAPRRSPPWSPRPSRSKPPLNRD